MLVLSQRKQGKPATLPEPIVSSSTELWPDTSVPLQASTFDSTYWATQDSGQAFADELIDAGPLSQYSFDKTNESIQHWESLVQNAVQNGLGSMALYFVDARDLWSVLGDIQDGNTAAYPGETQVSAARRILDTWADYSTAMQNEKPQYKNFRSWVQLNGVYVAPGFI